MLCHFRTINLLPSPPDRLSSHHPPLPACQTTRRSWSGGFCSNISFLSLGSGLSLSWRISDNSKQAPYWITIIWDLGFDQISSCCCCLINQNLTIFTNLLVPGIPGIYWMGREILKYWSPCLAGAWLPLQEEDHEINKRSPCLLCCLVWVVTSPQHQSLTTSPGSPRVLTRSEQEIYQVTTQPPWQCLTSDLFEI